MKYAIVYGLPYLLSGLTLYMTLMVGNRHPKSWALGMFVQLLWLVWIATSEAWGFLPMNLCLWVVYIRNHLKWSKA